MPRCNCIIHQTMRQVNRETRPRLYRWLPYTKEMYDRTAMILLEKLRQHEDK